MPNDRTVEPSKPVMGMVSDVKSCEAIGPRASSIMARAGLAITLTWAMESTPNAIEMD